MYDNTAPIRVLVLAALLAASCTVGCAPGGAARVADEGRQVFIADFDNPDVSRYEFLEGKWVFDSGRLKQVELPGKDERRYKKRIALIDFPLREGIIEVRARAVPCEIKSRGADFGAIGVIGKYVDAERSWGFRHGSSNNISGYGYFAQNHGAWTFTMDKPSTLKVVFANSMVGLIIDDMLVALKKDPLAGEAGRPGVYCEARTDFEAIKITRFK